MDAHFIKQLLAHKYQLSKGWAFFEEFMLIDAVAVGTQSRNPEIIAFEIKTSRGDFLKDIKAFQTKQSLALEISHKFYYICPWGLIDKHEVPDIAGIQYIDSANNIKIKKIATLRIKKAVPMSTFQAFALNFGSTFKASNIPVKYLGKEISQEAFQELVNEGTRKKRDYEIERGIEKGMNEFERKKSERDVFVSKLRRILWIDADNEGFYEAALRYCELGQLFCKRYPLKDSIQQLKGHLNKIEGLIQENKQLKLKKEKF